MGSGRLYRETYRESIILIITFFDQILWQSFATTSAMTNSKSTKRKSFSLEGKLLDKKIGLRLDRKIKIYDIFKE